MPEEYDPEEHSGRIFCEHCNTEIQVRGYQTICLGCGLVGENPDFACNYQNYNQCSYNIKTLEQKDAELRLTYVLLTSQCTQLLKKLKFNASTIDLLVQTTIERLRKLEKTNETILRKLFASHLYLLSS